ncbi:MAG TPA: CoA transferase [Desulfotomaculum sp.]|nr:MAG: hypothetical protein JL56_06850 [Desulfotomaculum sp. BICA1-6]HBX24490.1 CoA transferase [Desulfotomaculum sp.]
MLTGIRVLDLSRLLPGPYATMLLGDMGAEVIKVEEPGLGDYMRQFTPLVEGTGVFFLAVNRNKKSVTLNLKTERGREILRAMIKKADVLLESFRPGVMDRLGLGYDTVREINPGLVYCSLSGYGQDGPDRDRAGHDVNYLAASGVLGITGVRDGQPVMPGVQVADLTGGMFAVIGILSALWQRQSNGRGTYLDVAMADGLYSMMSMHLAALMNAGVPAARGNMMLSGALACYSIYQTKDGGYVALGALENKFWKNFCQTLDRSDMLPGHLAMAVDGDQVYEELKNIFLSRTTAQWREFADRTDCCLSVVNDAAEVVQSAYARERGLITDVPLTSGKTMSQVRNPIVFPGAERKAPLSPPELGQHNSEIYGSLAGLSDAELDELRRDGVI